MHRKTFCLCYQEIPYEVDEDEETVKIVQLVKSQDCAEGLQDEQGNRSAEPIVVRGQVFTHDFQNVFTRGYENVFTRGFRNVFTCGFKNVLHVVFKTFSHVVFKKRFSF